MNFRRILLIIAFILITLGIGYAIYSLFFAPPSEQVVPTANENVNAGGAGLPTAVNGGAPTNAAPTNAALPPTVPVAPVAAGGLVQVTPVSSTPTIGASLATNGSLNYYNQTDGKFYRVNADGTTSSLSNQKFFDVQSAKFAPDGNKAIIEYPDGSKIYYDFNTNKQVTLPKHWEDFDFNSNGTQIAAKSIGIDEGNRFVVVSNPDGSGAHAVQELGSNADRVKVNFSPSGQVVATAETGPKCGVDCEEVYLVGQNQENFKTITVYGLGFEPKWSPTGQQLLYSAASSTSDWKPQLWTVDAEGDDIGRNRRSINLNTFADKCTYADTKTLYCAVPQDLPVGAGVNRDVADDYPDTLYKVDLNTGLTTQIAVPEGGHTISSVMVTQDKKTLYFTDKNSGLLNKVQLK